MNHRRYSRFQTNLEMLTRRKLLQDKELINNKKHVVDSYDEINHLSDFSNSDLNCKIRIRN